MFVFPLIGHRSDAENDRSYLPHNNSNLSTQHALLLLEVHCATSASNASSINYRVLSSYSRDKKVLILIAAPKWIVRLLDIV